MHLFQKTKRSNFYQNGKADEIQLLFGAFGVKQMSLKLPTVE
jgi:hypothetical protein